MKNQRNTKSASIILSTLVLFFAIVTPATAQPSNDNFSSATVITGTTFTDVVDNTTATVEVGEPAPCYNTNNTVWYTYTPSVNTTVTVDLSGSSFYFNAISVYQVSGPGFAGLSFMNCGVYNGPVTFVAQAGVTYFFQASDFDGIGGNLKFNFQVVPVPANDNFANAKIVTALPYNDPENTITATVESGEPTPSCMGPYNTGNTVWYSFTPTTSGTISAEITGANFSTVIAAYTGSILTGLSETNCLIFNQRMTLQVNAGTRYNFQVVSLFSQSGPLQFNLYVTPPPVANFNYSPNDPSTFDIVQFCDYSYDPGQLGFLPPSWSFGDGATTTGNCVPHQYSKDGDYTVNDVVTTIDGRSGSASSLVQVRTHDVAITKLTAPTSASAGQTRQIAADIKDTRYPENVQVQLFKSDPTSYDGYLLVGTLNQQVPVRASNRTTSFGFNYTFTSNDAKIGKVTFKAVATIFGARDALISDNVAISSPTKVSR